MVEALHGKFQPVKLRGPMHCSSGDMRSLVIEGKDSTFSRLNLPLLLTSKGHGMKAFCVTQKRNRQSFIVPTEFVVNTLLFLLDSFRISLSLAQYY